LRHHVEDLLCAGAANFSASGLKRQDNDLIVLESAGSAAMFKRACDARFSGGENLSLGGDNGEKCDRFAVETGRAVQMCQASTL
jgi:hypothetical protein